MTELLPKNKININFEKSKENKQLNFLNKLFCLTFKKNYIYKIAYSEYFQIYLQLISQANSIIGTTVLLWIDNYRSEDEF